jgi:hypothetical protein
MRHRHQRLAKQMSYQRVLLAIYWLADDLGLVCAATNAQIARAAGRGVETVQGCLREMGRDGTVTALGHADGLPKRVLVLMDTPGGHAYVEHTRNRGPRAVRESAAKVRAMRRRRTGVPS